MTALAHLLERNVLAIQRLDQVLLAVNDLDVAVPIEFANVARLEPAIRRERVLRLLVVLVIAVRHAVTSDPYLALRWPVLREVARLWKVDQLHFDTGGEVSDGFVGPFHGVHEGTHATSIVSVSYTTTAELLTLMSRSTRNH